MIVWQQTSPGARNAEQQMKWHAQPSLLQEPHHPPRLRAGRSGHTICTSAKVSLHLPTISDVQGHTV